MTFRRLSNEALFLVLACLALGTLVLAGTTVRAWSKFASAGAAAGCMSVASRHGEPCAVHVAAPARLGS